MCAEHSSSSNSSGGGGMLGLAGRSNALEGLWSSQLSAACLAASAASLAEGPPPKRFVVPICCWVQCDDDADVAAMWHEVWEESATSAGAGLRLHVKEITQARMLLLERRV
jgi:hypothetical protein